MMWEHIANECALGSPGLNKLAYERFIACPDRASLCMATQELGRP